MVRLLVSTAVVTVTLWILSGYVTDPLGFTTRESIRSATAIETTRLETNAEIRIAEVESLAKVKVAEAQADAETSKASEQRKVHQTWARTAPILLLIVAAMGALWFGISYWGQALLLLVQHVIERDFLAMLFSKQQLSDEPNHDEAFDVTAEDALDAYAAQRNQYVIRQNGYHLLVDNQTNEVVSQLTRK